MSELTFYEKFKQTCDANHDSMSRVLDQLGLSRGNLARWKSGVKPKLDTMIAISSYFDLPPNYFYSEQENSTYEEKRAALFKLGVPFALVDSLSALDISEKRLRATNRDVIAIDHDIFLPKCTDEECSAISAIRDNKMILEAVNILSKLDNTQIEALLNLLKNMKT